MDLSKIPSAENWRKIVSRGKYPLIFMYELNQGLLNTHKITGFKTRMKNYGRTGGSSYLYEPEVQPFIAELRKVLRKDPKRSLEWLDEYFLHTKELFQWVKKVNKRIGSKHLSKEELKKLYSEYEKRMLVIWQWGYLPFLIDDAIGLELNDLLVKLGVEPKAITETIKILGTSSKFTLAKKQEFELLGLAEKVERGGLDKYKKQIEEHLKKWGWKNSWIYSQHDLTLSVLEGEVLAFSRKNPGQILKDIKTGRKKEMAQKRKILTRYKDKQLDALADVLAEYHNWHTFKMEEITTAIYLLRPTLFKELGEKLDLSFEEIIELTPEEVRKEDISKEVVRDRLRDNGIMMINGETKVLSHAEIKQVENILERTYSDTEILKGIVAFKGNVKGEAAVLPSGNIDISKISVETGRIIVTSMTTPNMVSLVRNAIGIVTDEGGLLCHAAIISRELGLPCITGTKIATKIIKDGDLIEIDADNSVVRIIKRARQ